MRSIDGRTFSITNHGYSGMNTTCRFPLIRAQIYVHHLVALPVAAFRASMHKDISGKSRVRRTVQSAEYSHKEQLRHIRFWLAMQSSPWNAIQITAQRCSAPLQMRPRKGCYFSPAALSTSPPQRSKGREGGVSDPFPDSDSQE